MNGEMPKLHDLALRRLRHGLRRRDVAEVSGVGFDRLTRIEKCEDEGSYDERVAIRKAIRVLSDERDPDRLGEKFTQAKSLAEKSVAGMALAKRLLELQDIPRDAAAGYDEADATDPNWRTRR